MTLPRRRLLNLGAAAALSAMSRGAAADDYPARPVRLFVTVPAGGSPDIIGRLIAQASKTSPAPAPISAPSLL
jgi:tripartite-type tricarboxylate transporter receptor subunit TctC